MLLSLSLAAGPVNGCPYLDLQRMLDATLEPRSYMLLPPALTTIPEQPPATLATLLDQIERRLSDLAATLRTTASYFARYIGAAETDLELGTVHAALPGVEASLGQVTQKNGSSLTAISISSYVNYAHILLSRRGN